MSRTTDVLRVVCGAIEANRDHLGDLDAALGDGDHGVSMAKTFSAVESQLDGLADAAPGAVLEAVGTTIMTSVGGAMGPLFGSAFMAAGEALDTASRVDGASVASAIAAARDRVAELGGANVGDKTMLDALDPAARAARQAADAGDDVDAVVVAAARGAEEGARATIEMLAVVGRASRLGPRSIGTADPGATSVAIMLRAATEALAGQRTGNPATPPPSGGLPAQGGSS